MIVRAGLAAFGLFLSAGVSAATIGSSQVNGSFAIDPFEPLGQSFKAVDAKLTSIGFSFVRMNPSFPQLPVRVDLYTGTGTSGTLLASRTSSAPNAVQNSLWFDFDFAGVTLTPGQTYSAALSIEGWSPYLGVNTSSTNPYADGQMFGNGIDFAGCDTGVCDLAFRVTGSDVAPVPEPATWAMMIAGLAAAGAARRRRRIMTAAAA